MYYEKQTTGLVIMKMVSQFYKEIKFNDMNHTIRKPELQVDVKAGDFIVIREWEEFGGYTGKICSGKVIKAEMVTGKTLIFEEQREKLDFLSKTYDCEINMHQDFIRIYYKLFLQENSGNSKGV